MPRARTPFDDSVQQIASEQHLLELLSAQECIGILEADAETDNQLLIERQRCMSAKVKEQLVGDRETHHDCCLRK